MAVVFPGLLQTPIHHLLLIQNGIAGWFVRNKQQQLKDAKVNFVFSPEQFSWILNQFFFFILRECVPSLFSMVRLCTFAVWINEEVERKKTATRSTSSGWAKDIKYTRRHPCCSVRSLRKKGTFARPSCEWDTRYNLISSEDSGVLYSSVLPAYRCVYVCECLWSGKFTYGLKPTYTRTETTTNKRG